jgi:hypothetical protein
VHRKAVLLQSNCYSGCCYSTSVNSYIGKEKIFAELQVLTGFLRTYPKL